MLLMGESVVDEGKKPTNDPKKRVDRVLQAISVPKSSDTPALNRQSGKSCPVTLLARKD
jgi:hypothetical protein